MFKFKINITNPQALEYINKFKSGEIKLAIINWLKRFKIHLAVSFVLIVIITAAVIGKSLSQKNPTPIYRPPVIENPSVTSTSSKKSIFQPLRESVSDFNSSMPDPAIPEFDNNVNLEPAIL